MSSSITECVPSMTKTCESRSIMLSAVESNQNEHEPCLEFTWDNVPGTMNNHVDSEQLPSRVRGTSISTDNDRHHCNKSIDANATNELPPVVVVDGFLSAGLPGYWGPLEELFAKDLQESQSWLCNGTDASLLTQEMHTPRRVLFVKPGCTSSLHDRACEIFYQLKGGVVDYGEEHAREHGHARFGRVYHGIYPEWSVHQPLHFIGHSLGGNTLLTLQKLLSDGHFPGHDISPDMMVSLTTLCSPLHGTPFVHWMGAIENEVPGSIRKCSGGWWLVQFTHLYEYFGCHWVYDFNLDHWGFRIKYPHQTIMAPLESTDFDGYLFVWMLVWLVYICEYIYTLVSRFGMLCRYMVRSPCFHSADNLPVDAMPKTCADFNAKWQPHCRTWYRSYTTSLNDQSSSGSGSIRWTKDMPSLILSLGQLIVRSETRKAVENPKSQGQSLGRCKQCQPTSDWLKGDGVVPLPSQYHPKCCCQMNCFHDELPDYTSAMDSETSNPPLPGSGHWETVNVADSHHVGIVPYRRPASGLGAWDRVFTDYARWLRQIDEARMDPPYAC
ncbi:Alpha/Beta hydrolase protein [Syncephalis plumigaleata]|nr:Alpha/Beta hydrolase protein [Syncephalis plumigaleata]